MAKRNTKTYYNRRKGALRLERSTFISHYKELAEFIKPRRGRFLTSDRNKGDKRYAAIINSRATQAIRIATSGMLAGTMSPTRPWFSLATHNESLMESTAVKEWLFEAENKITTVLNDSNFYGQASSFLSELILFGTAAISHVDDFEDVARFYTHTAGSYMIAQNDRFEVDTIYREFEWTASQIVSAFGIENVSVLVKDAHNKGNMDLWFLLCHVIEPNENYDGANPLSQNKRFKSVYYEVSTMGVEENKRLSEKGFDEFPVYVARWDVTGEDVYGTDCPAMTALGDIKGLQLEEKRKAQAIDKMVNPPLTGPPSVRNVPVSSLPGSVTIYDGTGDQKLDTLYTVNPQLQELRADIDAIERRIDTAFFVDLFLAISNIEGIQPRNQLDLMQRNEERLLQLGPVLERLHGEFLDKMIDRLFNQLIRADVLSAPPEELSGAPLKIKYISNLAMAQRAVATQGIDRLAAFAGGLMQSGWENAGAKFDAEQAIDEYAKAIGTPPSIVVPDEVLAEQRAVEAERQQDMEALEQAQQVANIAKMGADAKTTEPSVLTELTGA